MPATIIMGIAIGPALTKGEGEKTKTIARRSKNKTVPVRVLENPLYILNIIHPHSYKESLDKMVK